MVQFNQINAYLISCDLINAFISGKPGTLSSEVSDLHLPPLTAHFQGWKTVQNPKLHWSCLLA